MWLEKGGRGVLHLMMVTFVLKGPSLKRKAQFVSVYVDRKGGGTEGFGAFCRDGTSFLISPSYDT